MKPDETIGFRGALTVWGRCEWHTKHNSTNLSEAALGKQSYILQTYKQIKKHRLILDTRVNYVQIPDPH